MFRVNTVAPGFIETTAARDLIVRLAKNTGIDKGAARQMLIESLGGIPIGRPVPTKSQTRRVSLVQSLASIHGSEYVIDGGTLPTV